MSTERSVLEKRKKSYLFDTKFAYMNIGRVYVLTQKGQLDMHRMRVVDHLFSLN